jgi:hypothetical protein
VSFRRAGEAGAHGVLEDVLDGRAQMAVAFDDPGGEAVAEEVAPALVAAVERVGIDSVEALEAVREAPELGLDDEVVVVRQQAEGVDAPVVPLDLSREESQEEAVIVRVAEGGGARDASRRHVVDALRRKLFARSPHAAKLAPGSPATVSETGQRCGIVTLSSRTPWLVPPTTRDSPWWFETIQPASRSTRR